MPINIDMLSLHRSGTPRHSKPRLGRNVNLLTQNLRVVHQRVNIDVDLAPNRISGFTEISVVPASKALRSVTLDCREMNITHTSINGKPVSFIYKDMLYINDDQTFEDYSETNQINLHDIYADDFDIHQHHLLRQKLNYVFGDIGETSIGNTEELTVLLPDHFKFEYADTNTPAADSVRSKLTFSESFAPFQLLIEYECVNPKNGVNFITTSQDRKLWHAYTTNSDYNVSTSSWVPCIDNFWERSTWQIEINIPRTVGDIGKPRLIGSNEPQNEDEDEDENDESEDSLDLTVCSGDFKNVKESPHSMDLSKKVVSWSIFNPVCAHHVGWAVGCFEAVSLGSVSQQTEELEESAFDDLEKENNRTLVTIYCLPGQQELAQNTCIFASSALEYFLKEFGSFPFSSYAITFVSGSVAPTNNFAGISMVNDKLLYPADIIEPMFEVTETILEGICTQWSGINVVAQTFNDLWCTIGIARFMAFLFIKELMGTNQYRYQIKKQMDKVVEKDIGRRPLALQCFRYPISDMDLSFLRLKAPLVLFILDRRMTKTDKSFGLSRVLPKLFLQAMSGELSNGTLSTSHFQYVCEKVNRNRLDVFFNQWVYGAGVPIINVTQTYNKKRSMIEMNIRQVQHLETKKLHPQSETFIEDTIAYLDNEPSYPIQPIFLGPMTIRVHEADGTPYEHIVDLKDGAVKFDIQYNTRHRRLKKNREEGGESIKLNLNKLGDVLTSPEDAEEWQLKDWIRTEEDILNGEPFEWIRVDTDFEWIAQINVKQHDYMFGSQLQYDRDVEAQLEAIRYFGNIEKPTPLYCSVLTRTIMDSRYFYGVRISAARAIVQFSKVENNFMGIDYLLKAYQQLFCFKDSWLPVSNDFNDFNTFLFQKEIPHLLSEIRSENGDVPRNIKTLLLNLVKYNDNAHNEFQDCYYVAGLVGALTKCVINSDYSKRNFIDLAVSEINRVQKLDGWIPSFHNMVSVACLKLKISLAYHGLLKLSFEDLLYFTLKRHSNEVRAEAFRGLVLLGGLKNAAVLEYFLKVCLLESSTPEFRNSLIQGLIGAVSVAAVSGTPSTLDDPEFKTLEKILDSGSHFNSGSTNMVVVEDGSNTEAHKRRDVFARETLKGSIELLRRDYAVGTGLKHILWELLHTSLISIHERRDVFNVCQILYEEIDSYIVRLPVPSDMTKKFVLKHLGNGKIVIKREGRFKIQLSAKVESSKPKVAKSRSETAEPKLKLKLTTSGSDIKKSKPSLVVFDPYHKGRVTLRIGKNRLPPLVSDYDIPVAEPQRNLVSFMGSLVTFLFTDKSKLAMAGTEKPKRYVKIFTKEKRIELSLEPFPEMPSKEDEVIEIDEPVAPKVEESKVENVETVGEPQSEELNLEQPKPEGSVAEELDKDEMEGTDKAAEDTVQQQEDQMEVDQKVLEPEKTPETEKSAEPEKASEPEKPPTPEELPEEKAPERRPKLKLTFGRPKPEAVPSKPVSRESLAEPDGKDKLSSPFSRSASPFDTASPGKSKKKKTKIYVHKSRSASEEPEQKSANEERPATEPVSENGHSAASETTPSLNGENQKNELTTVKPKPAFKLKLNLKNK